MPHRPIRKELLSRAELDELETIEQSGLERCTRRQRQIAWSLLFVVFSTSTLWVHTTQGEVSGYTPYFAIMLGAFVTGLSSIFLWVGAWSVAEWATNLATKQQQDAHLARINYAKRHEEQIRSETNRETKAVRSNQHRPRPGGDGRPQDGRSYPVTDGQYDPELYRRRGGYDTFSRMTDAGIDDYGTYKNNVLEAD